jgi:hypothetical protein
MIDNILNLLFRCPHRRLTRPLAPVSKAGQPHSQSYVVCLDCGKQFEYDVNQMRIGKPVDHTSEAAVVPPHAAKPRQGKMKYVLWSAVPAAFLLGALLKPKQPAKPGAAERTPEPQKPKPGEPEDPQ